MFSLVPIIWMYVTALRPRDDALAQSVLPTGISLDNLRAASDLLPLGGLIGNTTVMAAAVALFQLFSALLAAYAFGCWRFRGDRVLFLIFVATWLVPFQITMLPNYVLLSDLGWLNTLTGVIVPQITAPFAVLLLRQHMRSFPRELLDAARMDGRSHWNTLWTVVVPSMRGPLAALAILLFVTAWNEYFWPLLVLSDPASVAQIGLEPDHRGRYRLWCDDGRRRGAVSAHPSRLFGSATPGRQRLCPFRAAMTGPLNGRRGRVPVYRQVERDLLSRIRVGELAPGQRLPTEPELAAEWGSIDSPSGRPSVNWRAPDTSSSGRVLELTLPSLQWSSSWCFRQCRPPTPTRAAPPHFAEHGRHDQTETLVKITDFDTDRDAAEALGVPGPFIQVVTLVRTGGQPFMVCRYWLEARRFPNFTALITERVALFEVLQERYGLRPGTPGDRWPPHWPTPRTPRYSTCPRAAR
ncbi:hypothetical protein GCM10020255_078470 [Rhodococcus baikonurensis]